MIGNFRSKLCVFRKRRDIRRSVKKTRSISYHGFSFTVAIRTN